MDTRAPRGLSLQPTELQPHNARQSSHLELRPVSTVLEAYLADLADRAGLPRPGILSPDSSGAGAPRPDASESNVRSDPAGPAPSSQAGA